MTKRRNFKASIKFNHSVIVDQEDDGSFRIWLNANQDFSHGDYLVINNNQLTRITDHIGHYEEIDFECSPLPEAKARTG